MGIYDVIDSQPAYALAEAQWRTNSDLSQLIGQNLNSLTTIYLSGYKSINNNSYGLTVEQVVAGVGPADWQKFYTEAVWLKSIINHCKPGTIDDLIGASAIALTSSNDSPTGGSTVTLTCSLTPNYTTGTCSFFDDTTLLGMTLVTSGVATLDVALATGTHNLSVFYSGDINFCFNTATHVVTAS